MSILHAIIIGIIEGITEFLPISSTGHMIITQKILGIPESEFIKIFLISIQLGAIMAVVMLYWKKFFEFKNWKFYMKLIIAVIPALVFGMLFSDKIDSLLESSLTISITMLAGGLILLFIDSFFRQSDIKEEEHITYPKAFIIGLWQCVAMVPGVSRSAASIIGGMQQKLTRNLAAEFSFFLAVPTMFAATAYKLFVKNYAIAGLPKLRGYEIVLNSTDNIKAFVIGNIVAFIVAMIAIKFFIGFLQKKGFKLFGYYRIVVGIILLVLLYTGILK